MGFIISFLFADSSCIRKAPFIQLALSIGPWIKEGNITQNLDSAVTFSASTKVTRFVRELPSGGNP